MVGPDWDGRVSEGIPETNVIRPPSPTGLAFAIAHIFVSDKDKDSDEFNNLINEIAFYPVSEFNGNKQVWDWAQWTEDHRLPPCWLPRRRDELQFVRPESFLRHLRAVMDNVRPQENGEKDLYLRIDALLDATAADWRIRVALRETFRLAEDEMITPLMQWRRNGYRSGNTAWNTSVNSEEWGTSKQDYEHRTATARSNMFESRPSGTRYYYTDYDSDDKPLSGENIYRIHFPTDPPVNGFWSLTLYDEFHFFFAKSNPLDRYSLGTKDKEELKYNPDGSLTLYAGGSSPGADRKRNWLPAPEAPFSLYIRVYWPTDAIGTWQPPEIRRIDLATMPT